MVKPKAKRMRTAALWYVHHPAFERVVVYDGCLDRALQRWNDMFLAAQVQTQPSERFPVAYHPV